MRYDDNFKRDAKERLEEFLLLTGTEKVGNRNGGPFVCPCCKSGNGPNHTAAFYIFRGRDGQMRFKCHSCGASGDVFQLASLIFDDATSFPARANIVNKVLNGVSFENRRKEIKVHKFKPAITEEEIAALQTKAQEYIEKCKKDVWKTDYFRQRGFTNNIVKEFNLGYDPSKKMAVIPYTSKYYSGRFVDVGQDQKQQGKRLKHFYPPKLRREVFNIKAIGNKGNEPVFIVEAPIDAMSIVQANGQAIALGSTNNPIFTKSLDVFKPSVSFILALDNDARGREGQEKIKHELEQRGIKYSEVRHSCFKCYKDANQALVSNPSLLISAVAYEKDRILHPIEISEHMTIEEESYDVRNFVANNTESNVDLLDKLSMDPSWSIRNAVASNIRVSSESLIKLMDDPNETVKKSALLNYNMRQKNIKPIDLIDKKVDELREKPKKDDSFSDLRLRYPDTQEYNHR